LAKSYDNMKQVRLSPTEFNPLFLDFAHHYGFVPKTHRVRRPRTKGKVERMVDYLKDNFLLGRTFADLSDLNAQARHWLDHTANSRLHQTTHQRPLDLWALERPTLMTVSSVPPYALATLEQRRVTTESFVHYQGSRYSVPPHLVGQSVLLEVRLGESRLTVRSDNLIVAQHPLAAKRGSCITEPAHLEALWKLSLAHSPPPPQGWQLTFGQTVAVRPLSVYEEVVG
jgi:hypothetical protein